MKEEDTEEVWWHGSSHPKAALCSPIPVLLHPWSMCQVPDLVQALCSLLLLLKGGQEKKSMGVLERRRMAGEEGHH